MSTFHSVIIRFFLASVVFVGFLASGSLTPTFAQIVPLMSSPAPGSTLTSTTVSFSGGHAGQVGEQHWLSVETSPLAKDIFHNSLGTGQTATVSGLPTSGTLYVRYWTYTTASGAWEYQSHTYTMAAGGSGGSSSSSGGNSGSSGGSTGGSVSSNGVFPPPMSSPVPGTTLSSTTVTFTGEDAGQAGEQHWLSVETSPLAKDIFHDSLGTGQTATVSGLPTSGTLYVRYWTYTSASSTWEYQSHTYTMAAGGSGGSSGSSGGSSGSSGGSTGGSSGSSGGSTGGSVSSNGVFPPPMSSPAPGTTLSSTTVTFTGTHAGQAGEQHWLSVETSPLAKDIFHDSLGTGQTATVSGLPTSGTLYVRYWTYTSASSTWEYQSHTYTMAAGGSGGSSGSSGGSTGGSSGSIGGNAGVSASSSGVFPPPMSSPVPGTTLSSTTVTFTGEDAGQAGEQHWLSVETSPLAKDIFHDSLGTGQTATVSGLPTSGTLYVRYWTYTSASSTWEYQSHTYTMAAGGSGGSSGSSGGSSGSSGGSTGGSVSSNGVFPPPMSSPAPGTTLSSTTVTFTGTHAGQAGEQHWLSVETSPLAKDIFHDSLGTGQTATVSGLPTSGTLYVRYWTYTSASSTWEYQSHTYTMAAGGSGGSSGSSGGNGGGSSSGSGKHLFMLSGQSNMAQLNPNTSFTPAVKNAFGQNNVIVVKDALGGAPISRWYKEWISPNGDVPAPIGDLYNRLMVRVNQAIQGQTIETMTFVWMQGEHEGRTAGFGAVYAASLQGLFAQLRNDLGRQDINFVIGRLTDFAPMNTPLTASWSQVRQAQVAVAEAHSRGAWVNTDDLNGVINDLHYTVEGYNILGQRFAVRAIQLINSH